MKGATKHAKHTCRQPVLRSTSAGRDAIFAQTLNALKHLSSQAHRLEGKVDVMLKHSHQEASFS